MRYEKLYRLTLNEGGATVRLKDGAVIGYGADGSRVPATGYVVGAHDGTWAKFPIDHLSTFDVSIDRLVTEASKNDWTHIGTWLHEGEIYIDPVYVFSNRDFAAGVAFANKQLAMYDLSTGKTIHLRRNR